MGAINTIRRLLSRSGAAEGTGTVGVEADEMLEFERRNVAATADHQFGFFGVYGYTDDDGDWNRVERKFDVYTDDERRRDGKPVADVRESHVRGVDVRKIVDKREFDIAVDADTDSEAGLEHEVAAALERWHRNTDPRGDDGDESAADGESASEAPTDD